MNESPVINKDIVADHSIDFIALKEQGVKKLQTLSGNNWTDYNLHDPGITILETLCYSLADLSYRAGFDINDILYSSAKFKLENSLYPPHEILTTSPLSPIDFKGLILYNNYTTYLIFFNKIIYFKILTMTESAKYGTYCYQ